MHSGRRLYLIAAALCVLAAAEGKWVYDWPYGAAGACRCKRIALETAGHATETACLAAFAAEPFEHCWTEAGAGRLGGITETDCANFAVSVSATKTNLDCSAECLQVVVGALPRSLFLRDCSLEVVARAGSTVSPLPSGCFVNYVLGHSDFDVAKLDAQTLPPLRVFEEVESAAMCQALCQQLPACAWFQWRAVASDACNSRSTGGGLPAHSCQLYDYSFVQAVMEFDVEHAANDLQHYAGGVCDLGQFEAHGCSDLFKTDSWVPFAPQRCLSCGCEKRCAFTSLAHISGPAYCSGDVLTDVCNILPPFPHTTTKPPEECPSTQECQTSECDTPTSGPAATTTTDFETTAEHSSTSEGKTATTLPASGTTEPPSAETTTGFVTQEGSTPPPEETTTGFETVQTTTGFQTATAPKSCPPCPPCADNENCDPCPPCGHDCVGANCRDANWEPQDLRP